MKKLDIVLDDLGGLKRSDFDIKIRGKKYNRIKSFSILWWLIRASQVALIIGAVYGFYVLMWTLIG